MPEFQGSIRLEDGDGDTLDTKLTVDSGRLVVTAGEHEIGDWAIEELFVERHNGEFRVRVEGEELVLGVNDPVGFHQGLGLDDRRPKLKRSAKLRKEKRSTRKTDPPAAAPTSEPSQSAAPTEAQPGSDNPSLWNRLSLRSKLVGAGAIALAVLGVFAPSWLALLLLLAGMVTLFLGIAARNDSGTSILPPPFFATTGAGVLGIALVLVAVALIALT